MNFLFSACKVFQRSITHKFVPTLDLKQQQRNINKKNQTLKSINVFSCIWRSHSNTCLKQIWMCSYWNKRQVYLFQLNSYPDTCITMNAYVWIIAHCVLLIGRENDVLYMPNLLFSHINSFSISSLYKHLHRTQKY